jgi:hypothetical protein
MGIAPGESSCRKISKSLVRRGEAAKGKSDSSKITCRETVMLGGEIETPIAFVIGRVSEDDTSRGPGCQFMRCLGGEVGIAGTTKYSQVLIGGGDTVESDIGAGCADRFAGKTVQQICNSVEPFYPVASQERSLKEQGANHVINGAESTRWNRLRIIVDCITL